MVILHEAWIVSVPVKITSTPKSRKKSMPWVPVFTFWSLWMREIRRQGLLCQHVKREAMFLIRTLFSCRSFLHSFRRNARKRPRPGRRTGNDLSVVDCWVYVELNVDVAVLSFIFFLVFFPFWAVLTVRRAAAIQGTITRRDFSI